MASRSEQIVDALSATLIVADLSSNAQRDALHAEVREAAKWAKDAGDVVIQMASAEASTVLEQLVAGEIDATTASRTLAELLAAASEACRHAESEPRLSLPAEQNRYAADEALVTDFISGAAEQLDEAETLLSAAAMGDSVDVDALFRCIHTLKGMSGFLSLDELANASHAAEAVLEEVRSDGRVMTETEVEQTLAAVDHMRGMIAGVLPEQQANTHEKATRKRSSEHVRVNAARLEGLLDAMGELAVAEAELSSAVKRSGDGESIRCLERLERIARDMQGTATALRMVSLKQTFAKMARVVRDGVARSGCKAELVVTGENTEIDRAIAEALTDPLIHLLRNAIDHGIELPSERRAAGKPEAGRLELRAFHRSGSVYIEIEDDGRGIDPDKLVKKAVESGVDFDHERPLALIFRAGFSTAETVTEMSGRGVGMDAVASAVAALRGQLDVSSEPGKGAKFTIRLPLTLAIIDGIVMRAGADRYVVPTHFVERTVSVARTDVVSAAGNGQILMLHDGPVPVAPISGTMGGSLDSGEVAVVLADGEDRFALFIDEVIGQQSLVIKPLTGPTAAAVGPAGAALMGDGRVALVVDPAGLGKALRRGS